MSSTDPRSSRRARFTVVLVTTAALVLALASAPGASASPHPGKAAPRKAAAVPPDDPGRGMVYRGLHRSVPADDCHGRRLFRTRHGSCTHGPDEPPAGFAVHGSVPPAPTTLLAPTFPCDGDGVTGFRVQVLYVHAADVASRYATYRSSFVQWAADADTIYSASASETGGVRHIRFVQDATCAPTIPDVTIPAAADDDFGATEAALSDLGYGRSDRKYMLFVDATVYCGIGGVAGDDNPAASNANNTGPSYGRSDSGCWSGDVAAHELGHNLGAVQLSAPHTSGGYHCVDEYEVMCYSDYPNYPPMQYLCPDAGRDRTRLDCNHDDYYNTAPASGSYLATHWNVADNSFLVGGLPYGSVSGRVLRPDGTPIVGAHVVLDEHPGFSATTTATGAYSLPVVPDGDQHLTVGPCLVVARLVTVHGATTVNLVASSPADASYTCTGTAPSWTGAANALALTGDEATQTVTLPFSFRYYGQNYGTLSVSTNGTAGFVGTGTAFDNTALPTVDAPNATLYPFWDDLVVDSAASVRTQAFGTSPNRTFVVEWRNVARFDDAAQRISFEIVLAESGAIAFDYRNVGTDAMARAASATIGIENETGTSAVQAAVDTPALTGDASIAFAPRVPDLSIGDTAVSEGATGSRSARFTVTLSEPATRDVTASYATVAGDAHAGVDFSSRRGTVTIPAGSTSTTLSVPVLGDTTVEPGEAFSVWLSGAQGAALRRAVGVGRIIDDDPSTGLRVAIGDASLVEGRRGTRSLRFTVSLSGTTSSAVSVHYATANGSAIAGSDYTATSGTATIPAGSTSVAVSVPVRPDTIVESTESFTVALSNVVGATIGRTTGVGRILDDDA
jgi:hypothetical protein